MAPNAVSPIPWSGKVLIPCWVFQMAMTLANLGLYIFVSLLVSPVLQGSEYKYTNAWEVVFSTSILFTILNFFQVFVLIWQIVRFHKRTLSAKIMLSTQWINCIYLTICSLLEILGISGALDGGMKTVFDFSFVLAVTICFWGTLIYSIVLVRRTNKTQTGANVEAYGTDYELTPRNSETIIKEPEQSGAFVR